MMDCGGGIICSVDGCEREVAHRGMCSSHHQRWYRHGDPLAGGTPHSPKGEAMRWLRKVAIPFIGGSCLPWPFAFAKGYGRINVNGRMVQAHRLVCETVHGNPPTLQHEAAHGCGNRACCNPAHLRWAGRTENEADKLIHGKSNRGERHSMVKLTETLVRQIRESKGSQRNIAARFGINHSTVYKIKRGKTWGWMA